MTVIFSDEGLMENVRVRENILYFQQQTQHLETKNSELRHQIYVLKNVEEKVIHSTSSIHRAAPQGATIYRFQK